MLSESKAFGISLDLCISILNVIRISNLIFINSGVGKGGYSSSIKKMGWSEWPFIIYIG